MFFRFSGKETISYSAKSSNSFQVSGEETHKLKPET